VPLLRTAGFPSSTMWPGPMPTSMPSATLTHQLFGHNRHEPKIGEGALPPFWGGEAWSPSKIQDNTVSSGLRPTAVPSGILMH